MKRQTGLILTALLTALVLTFSPITTSSASPRLGPDNPPEMPDFAKETIAKARLIQINGSKNFILNPYFVEAVKLNDDTFRVTYEVGIPRDMLSEENSEQGSTHTHYFPYVVYADSESHNKCDSTVSVCALLTLYYTQIGDHGWYQKATNRWTRSDPTVSWSNAKIKDACAAEWYQGTGRCNTQVTKTIGVPTSGTTYTFTPWFAGSSNQVYLNGFNGIAAYQQITLQRGASTWQFSFCIAHEGSEIIIGCY